MAKHRATSLLLVDGCTSVRESLSVCFDRQLGLRVLGAVASAKEAVDQVLARTPDVVVAEIELPDGTGFDALQKIRSIQPLVRGVLLSATWTDRQIERALNAKACACLDKHESIDDLARALRNVAAGETCHSPSIQSRIETSLHDRESRVRRSALTVREIEVLGYIARGMAKKNIASLMNISQRTVERHTENLMSKLQIHDRVGLTRYAIREGLVRA